MKDFRLPKAALVLKGWEYDAIYRGGRRLYGEDFTLIYLPNSTEKNRLGISIHRKLRGAVKRNRLKRIIRESFRLNRDAYPNGADIVFAVRPSFSLTSPEEIRQVITTLCKAKSGLRND